MRAVVTGGAGFVGSHLIEKLVARGDDVVCLERAGAGAGWLRALPVRFRDCGLDDADVLAGELAGADVVYHLAALTQARASADYYRVNAEGTGRLLEAAARAAVGRLVFMSSLAAAGPCRDGECLTPETVPFPLSHYGHSKLLAEVVVHAWAEQVPAVVLRFPTVYGPRERAVLKLFQLVQHGIALTIGDWDRENSVIYVDDVVAALVAAASAPAVTGHTYCVTHPVSVTWRAFVAAVGAVLQRRPVMVSLPRAVGTAIALGSEAAAKVTRTAAILNRDRIREMTQRRWVCDGSRAEAALGFRAEWDLQRGVPATAAWYREAKWL